MFNSKGDNLKFLKVKSLFANLCDILSSNWGDLHNVSAHDRHIGLSLNKKDNSEYKTHGVFW